MSGFGITRSARRAINKARHASRVVGCQHLPGGALRTIFAFDNHPGPRVRRRRHKRSTEWVQRWINYRLDHAAETQARRVRNREVNASRPLMKRQPRKQHRPQCAARNADGQRCQARVMAWRDETTGAPMLGTLCHLHATPHPQSTATRPKPAHRTTRYVDVRYHSLGRALLATDLRMYNEKKRLTGIPKEVLRRFASGTQHPSDVQQQAMCILGIDAAAWQRQLDDAWLGSDGLPLSTSPEWLHEAFRDCLTEQVLRELRKGPIAGTAAAIARTLRRPTAYIARYLDSSRSVTVISTATGRLRLELCGRAPQP